MESDHYYPQRPSDDDEPEIETTQEYLRSLFGDAELIGTLLKNLPKLPVDEEELLRVMGKDYQIPYTAADTRLVLNELASRMFTFYEVVDRLRTHIKYLPEWVSAGLVRRLEEERASGDAFHTSSQISYETLVGKPEGEKPLVLTAFTDLKELTHEHEQPGTDWANNPNTATVKRHWVMYVFFLLPLPTPIEKDVEEYRKEEWQDNDMKWWRAYEGPPDPTAHPPPLGAYAIDYIRRYFQSRHSFLAEASEEFMEGFALYIASILQEWGLLESRVEPVNVLSYGDYEGQTWDRLGLEWFPSYDQNTVSEFKNVRTEPVDRGRQVGPTTIPAAVYEVESTMELHHFGAHYPSEHKRGARHDFNHREKDWSDEAAYYLEGISEELTEWWPKRSSTPRFRGANRAEIMHFGGWDAELSEAGNESTLLLEVLGAVHIQL